MSELYKKFKDVEIGDYIYSFQPSLKNVSEITKHKIFGKRIDAIGNDFVHLSINGEEIQRIPSNKSKITTDEAVFNDTKYSLFAYKGKGYIVCCDLRIIETIMKNNWLSEFQNITHKIDLLKNGMNKAVDGIKNARISVIELELNQISSKNK